MSRRVALTGASGFIGTHLAQELRDSGYHVLTHSGRDGDIAHCALEFDRVEHVFHLAGRTFVPDSWEQTLSFYSANVLGTVNVLEFCRRAGVPLTFVSSYVYGIPQHLPVDEDHPLQSLNPYSHTKILAEQAVGYYQAHLGVSASIVRPFNIYGPGQDGRFLVPMIIRQAIDPGCDRIVVRDARPRRDYLYVRDLTALLVATARKPGRVYNAGSGISIGVGELIEAVVALTHVSKPLAVSGDTRKDEVFDLVADITRAREELSWAPRVGLSEGLSQTIDWTRKQLARGQ